MFSSTENKSLYDRIDPYLRLARVQKQIGTHLLLLPCFWGIALGSPAYIPSVSTMALFYAGALGCRSAGCIINDLADRDIDKHVDRTKARPLTTGELSTTQAGLFLTGLMGVNFSMKLIWGGSSDRTRWYFLTGQRFHTCFKPAECHRHHSVGA